MYQLKSFFAVAILALIGFSCANNNSKKTADAVEDVIIEESKAMIRDVPAPKSKEIASSLIQAKAGFIFDITNSTDNINKYLTQKQKGLNLGVYSADLHYVEVYQKHDEVKAYIKAFVDLANGLKIKSVNSVFLERVDKNINIPDSLNAIINEAFINANASLNKGDRSEIAIFILAGSWIEGMYIVEKTMEFAVDIEPLWDIVIRNKETLSNLIKIMALDKENENIKDIYEDLLEIEGLFNKLEADGKDKATRDLLVSKLKELRASIVS